MESLQGHSTATWRNKFVNIKALTKKFLSCKTKSSIACSQEGASCLLRHYKLYLSPQVYHQTALPFEDSWWSEKMSQKLTLSVKEQIKWRPTSFGTITCYRQFLNARAFPFSLIRSCSKCFCSCTVQDRAALRFPYFCNFICGHQCQWRYSIAPCSRYIYNEMNSISTLFHWNAELWSEMASTSEGL